MEKQFRGIFAIPPTPFTSKNELDEAGLKRCIKFCLEAGCHGLVIPVVASEFTMLSEYERKRVIEIAAQEVAHKVPLVIGVAAASTKMAVDNGAYAEAIGADGLIAMPPYLHKASLNEIYSYYSELGKSVKIPIFIQNCPPPIGTPLSPEFMIRLVREIPHVDYIKEETTYSSHVIEKVLELAKDLPKGKFKGVMGGKAGGYLIDEYKRGACGNMPGCEIVDIQVRIWNYLESGDEKSAVALYNKVLPYINFEHIYGVALFKEFLRRRGVIDCAATRLPGIEALNRQDLKEIDRLLLEIEDLFTIRWK